MSVKIEASGRRSVQVDVEVPGTPEQVWKAIATGPGVSSWFVPTEFEERDGKPVAVTSKFVPGIEPRAAVTAWDPPRMFAAQGESRWRLQSRRPEHGCAELLPLRRSGGRDRRPRDTDMANVVSITLPDAVGDEPSLARCNLIVTGSDETIFPAFGR
jgi:hypothetical protein